MRLRTSFVAVAAFVGALLLPNAASLVDASAGTPGHSAPVLAPVPTHTSRGTRKTISHGGTVCDSPGDGLAASGGRVRPWVGPDPVGATVLWLPGMNSKPCKTVLTHLKRSRARKLADDVDSAKPFPPGTYNCPADDGSSATVFLIYPGRARAEVVRVAVTGCGGFSAPHRALLMNQDGKVLGPTPPGISPFG